MYGKSGMVGIEVGIEPPKSGFTHTEYAADTQDYAVLRGSTRRRRGRGARRIAVGMDGTPEVLTQQQVAELLQVSLRTVEGWRLGRGLNDCDDATRDVLRGKRVGGRIRYLRSEIFAAMSTQR